MWSLARRHLAACAICLAALLCPRASWDRARLAVLAALEGGPRAPEAAAAPPGPREAELRAEWIRAEAERAALELTVRQTTALRAASPAVRGEAVVPAIVLGGEGARATAARGGASRGGALRIDAGRRSRVEEGLPVTDGALLVGRIAAAGELAAEVELVTSLRFRARCRNARTGEEGVLRGAGDGTLYFRPESGAPDLRPGDAILTSPASGFAPANLTVGEIEAFARDAETGLPGATVRPAADLARLGRVLVIRRDGPAREDTP
jgi:hypothetical protein